jgi:hypothetical protein
MDSLDECRKIGREIWILCKSGDACGAFFADLEEASSDEMRVEWLVGFAEVRFGWCPGKGTHCSGEEGGWSEERGREI